jgi:hypothetical protein
MHYYAAISTDTPYLGLWKSTLPEDLGLGLTFEAKQHPRTDLPSWSPLSADQPVRFDHWHMGFASENPAESHLRIVHCEVNWAGAPYVSEILSSSLVVEGAVNYLTLSEVTEIPECDPPLFRVDGETVGHSLPMIPWSFRCAVQFDVPRKRGTKTYFCLLLSRIATEAYEFRREIFLILEPVNSESGQTKFRRIGIGSLRHNDEGWKFDLNNRQEIRLV